MKNRKEPNCIYKSLSHNFIRVMICGLELYRVFIDIQDNHDYVSDADAHDLNGCYLELFREVLLIFELFFDLGKLENEQTKVAQLELECPKDPRMFLDLPEPQD